MERKSSRNQESQREKGDGRGSRRDHAPSRRRVRRDKVSEKEEGIRGSSGIPLNVITKPEGAEWRGDDQEQPPETPDVEAPATQERPEETMLEESSPEEEMTPEDSPATATDRGVIMVEVSTLNDLGKISLLRDRCREEESLAGIDTQGRGAELW